MSHSNINKVSAAGLLVTLGIIFGDIGTSPLYVMKAIAGTQVIDSALVLGALSAVFWTLTLQTTLKYIIITLKADNNGEGGILALFNLVKKASPKLIWFAMIGAAMLLADGIITPPISVSSAVEGLSAIVPGISPLPIIIGIITLIFVLQPFGTATVGKSFGPLMFIWFTMLSVLGVVQIYYHPGVLAALNPLYALELLSHSEKGFFVLGAVFLCTTGAEALYSDLGHCGRGNIRISWIFVKVALLLNYFGQGAWMLSLSGSSLITASGEQNPFYEIMPGWFQFTGVIIATLAAIIASQALISGSFTLVSEAIRAGLFPRLKVNYPSDAKGQLFIPMVNFALWAGCVSIVLHFEKSANMEAAYGLAITVAMLMTTLLLAYYLLMNKGKLVFVGLLILLFLIVEGSFLVANLEKFMEGAYVTLFVAGVILILMFIWRGSNRIKSRLTEFVKIEDYKDQLVALSHDQSLPKYATHLVFLSTSSDPEKVESKILYSILQKQPKRADIYWFVHIELTDDPHTQEYDVEKLAENDVYRVTFYLGFKVQQRVNVFLRKVVEEMVIEGEIDIVSRYHSLRERNITGDFKFLLLEETFSYENQLPRFEEILLNAQIMIKQFTASPERWFGLDTSLVTVEKVPLIISPAKGLTLSRKRKNKPHG